VVGFDGSENAAYALDWAMRHAAAEHAPVTVLTVDEVAVNPYNGDPALMPADASVLEHARHAAQEAAAKAASQFPEASRPAVNVIAETGDSPPRSSSTRLRTPTSWSSVPGGSVGSPPC